MVTLHVMLSDIERVKAFIAQSSRLTEDVDVSSGRYTVDAKSILGIFSLDLNQVLTLTVHGDDEAGYRRAFGAFLEDPAQ